MNELTKYWMILYKDIGKQRFVLIKIYVKYKHWVKWYNFWDNNPSEGTLV